MFRYYSNKQKPYVEKDAIDKVDCILKNIHKEHSALNRRVLSQGILSQDYVTSDKIYGRLMKFSLKDERSSLSCIQVAMMTSGKQYFVNIIMDIDVYNDVRDSSILSKYVDKDKTFFEHSPTEFFYAVFLNESPISEVVATIEEAGKKLKTVLTALRKPGCDPFSELYEREAQLIKAAMRLAAHAQRF